MYTEGWDHGPELRGDSEHLRLLRHLQARPTLNTLRKLKFRISYRKPLPEETSSKSSPDRFSWLQESLQKYAVFQAPEKTNGETLPLWALGSQIWKMKVIPHNTL